MGNAEEGADPRVRMPAPACRAVAPLLGPYAEVVLHAPDAGRILTTGQPMDSGWRLAAGGWRLAAGEMLSGGVRRRRR
ncbi:hypothetical protein [Streptomyces caniferus]|uniref:hypothetical protein n=1 Tax=Streptomyces caniferus TaxID=285557 RepID=UPI00381B3115